MNNPLHRQFIFKISQSCFSLLMLFISILTVSCSEESSELKESSILQAKQIRSLTNMVYKSTPQRIARGKYLVEGPTHCFNCHSPRDGQKAGLPPIESKKGSGHIMWGNDSLWLYASNITPDKETGIGDFSDDTIVRAITEGVGHDGRGLAMPWESYRRLTKEDLASVVTYLRTIPAVKNKVPQRKLKKSHEAKLSSKAAILGIELKEPDFNDPVSRGKYLIKLGDCIDCHTGWGEHNPGILAGGQKFEEKEGVFFSTNITSDMTGIGGWTAESFIAVIRTGKGGTLHHRMPWLAQSNMTDKDLEAIYYALMTSHPVKHIVFNRVPPTFCEVCKKKHGLGNQNKKEHVIAYSPIHKTPTDISGLYVNEFFKKDTIAIQVDENKLTAKIYNKMWDLIAISETHYFADGLPAPLSFVRDKNGLLEGINMQDFGREIYKKIE